MKTGGRVVAQTVSLRMLSPPACGPQTCAALLVCATCSKEFFMSLERRGRNHENRGA
jgi:hypothetical protein